MCVARQVLSQGNGTLLFNPKFPAGRVLSLLWNFCLQVCLLLMKCVWGDQNGNLKIHKCKLRVAGWICA